MGPTITEYIELLTAGCFV